MARDRMLVDAPSSELRNAGRSSATLVVLWAFIILTGLIGEPQAREQRAAALPVDDKHSLS